MLVLHASSHLLDLNNFHTAEALLSPFTHALQAINVSGWRTGIIEPSPSHQESRMSAGERVLNKAGHCLPEVGVCARRHQCGCSVLVFRSPVYCSLGMQSGAPVK